MYVVQRVRRLAADADETFFVTGHTQQHAKFQQCAADGHQFAALVLRIKGKTETARRKVGFSGENQQSLAQHMQRDLRFGAFEHRARQT